MTELWRRFVRWSRLRRLHAIDAEMTFHLDHLRGRLAYYRGISVDIDETITTMTIERREIRAEIALFESPARMLAEALARRSDIH